MTLQETERMFELCRLMQAEKDPARFGRLCEELSSLMEQKEHRLAELEAKHLQADLAPDRPTHKN